MQGVYLVAAQLASMGLVASPTSRNAKGADILVSTDDCTKIWAVQVKTNKSSANFFLVGKAAKELSATNYVYVLVNLAGPDGIQYFVVPSSVVAKKTRVDKSSTGSEWWYVMRKDVEQFRNKWDLFTE